MTVYFGTDNDVASVDDIIAIRNGELFVVLTSGMKNSVHLLQEGQLIPAPHVSSDVSHIWPCDESSVLLATDSEIFRYRFPSSSSSPSLHKLLDLPKNVNEFDVAWVAKDNIGLVVVALTSADEEGEGEGEKDDDSKAKPIIIPPPRDPLALKEYRSLTGWVKVGECPAESESLQISQNGHRCTWRVMKNWVPEEAERGEIWISDLSLSASASSGPRQLTKNAGRVGCSIFSPDGASLIYTANYSLDKPITSHLDLWRIVGTVPSFPSSDESRARVVDRLNATAHVSHFGFPHNGVNSLFVTYTFGTTLLSDLVDLDSVTSASPLPIAVRLAHAVASQGAANLAGVGGADHLVFGTESMLEYPAIALPAISLVTSQIAGFKAVSSSSSSSSTPIPSTPSSPDSTAAAAASGSKHVLIPLPQPEGLEHLHIRTVQFAAKDGTPISGYFAFSDLSGGGGSEGWKKATVLLHGHGGPAVDFPCVRSAAGGATRYPYRHFLQSGYNIFMPHYRGTLGFGDKFSSANIRCQGELTADIGDIISGLEHLHSIGWIPSLDKSRIGVFGGSYGGYLTMRLMSTCPQYFGCGAALYGFIHGRWMSLETGDFTWETEYVNPISWPLSDDASRGDNFPNLHKIESPMMLLHGGDDPICPLSQSRVALRTLQISNIPTYLVVYPGEGHGFNKPANRKDRDERMLAWFQKYLPALPQ